jgi:hypothetical protein
MDLPFDMKRLQAAGDAFPVAQRIAESASPYWLAAASNHGVLAYVSGQRGGRQYVGVTGKAETSAPPVMQVMW